MFGARVGGGSGLRGEGARKHHADVGNSLCLIRHTSTPALAVYRLQEALYWFPRVGSAQWRGQVSSCSLRASPDSGF